MFPRSQPSGAQNRKRKKKEIEMVQSMQGSMNKFLVKPSNVSENPVNNPVCDDENICDENIENVCDDENIRDDDACDDDNIDDIFVDDIGVNIFDPRVWDGLNSKMKALLVEKGPIRETNITFPKDNLGRHFSFEYYVRKLRNGECYDRKWLVYSKELDKVFCFCCKIFKDGRSKSQLASEGLNCWKQLGQRLELHENSLEHLTNFKVWCELRLRLDKNQTLDKELQELIKKDTDHWKEVLVRIIATVKCLAKNNLAFRGTNQKLYEKSNGNFLGLTEMIAEFDPIMKQHFRLFEDKKNSLSLS